MPDDLELVDPQNNQRVATIVLNGYQIGPDGCSLDQPGTMRSFALKSGRLITYWSQQQVLHLRDNAGHTSSVRVAALPAEEDGYGLIQFL